MSAKSARKIGTGKSLGVIVFVLVTFASILGFVSRGVNTHQADIDLATWIQHWEGSIGEALYNIGDMLGTTSLAAIATVIGIIVFLVKRKLQVVTFLFLVLLLRLAGTQLKPIFDSPRPTVDELNILGTFDGTGYPSGHSMTVAMVSTMVVPIGWRYIRDGRARWIVTTLAAAAVILVGWSRVWSGAHWPSDVLGGWSYGIALTLIAWMLSGPVLELLSFRRRTAQANASS